MATETRKTDWVAFGHYGLTAYRIWVRKSETGFFQRHEWRRDDGSTYCDEWIVSIQRWPANLQHAVAA